VAIVNNIRSLLSVSFIAFVLIDGASAVEDKKDKKSPLPDNAVWELKPLDALFRVVETAYDGDAKKVTWTVETRDGYRTADFVRDITGKPFTFRFLNGDGNELAAIQLTKEHFRGLPNERVMRARTRLTIVLELPRAMPRTKKVVLQRGSAE
jgi:hypothetical protein